MTEPADVKRLLTAYRAGDRGALDELLPLVYDDLRLAAHRQLRKNPGGGIDTTSLVHEAYLRLARQSRQRWQDEGHFQAVAALAMRHVLIDFARRRKAVKRGGDAVRVTLSEGPQDPGTPTVDVLAVDQALTGLEALNERLARLVELRFFGGFDIDEAARALSISRATAKRDWQKARAFLFDALGRATSG